MMLKSNFFIGIIDFVENSEIEIENIVAETQWIVERVYLGY